MEIKKDVGVKSLRAYPQDQAFALPPSKDKQREACPRQVICIHYTWRISPIELYIRKDTPPVDGVHLIIYIRDHLLGIDDI